MDKEDMKLSVLRHATSKIADFNDLTQIQSLGFRGEALSSIASVSKFEMMTRKRGDESGWKLKTEGGKNIEIMPAALAEGTICEVNDLFFNTPVREKFLKADSTEKTRIVSIVEEIMLANSEVSFKLILDGKTVLNAVKTDNKIDRISSVLGKDFALNLKTLKLNPQKADIEIFFTDRDHCLTNRKVSILLL